MNGPPLVDSFGRVHRYLRLSVTDRCNYHCTYCVPPEGVNWSPRSDILTFEELACIARVFVSLGIEKIRLTGGEPTARAGIVHLVRQIAQLPGLKQLAMTTNGHTLARLAAPLANAGLHRVNISIDSLDSAMFQDLTGGGSLKQVLRGIHAARLAGLSPISLNAVILKGKNDHEVMDLVRFVEQQPKHLQLRFIEYMPFEVRRFEPVPSSTILAQIAQERTLMAIDKAAPTAGPAKEWFAPETNLHVGFITPLSQQFCATCNRLRMTATGHLRTCLAHEDTPSLRDLLRGGASDEELARNIRNMVMGKPEGHACTVEGGQPFEGIMTGIGG